MALLSGSSSAARSMATRRPAVNSPMMAAITSNRRELAAKERRLSADNAAIRRAIDTARKQDRVTLNRAERRDIQESLVSHRDSRKTIHTLEEILKATRANNNNNSKGLAGMLAGLLGGAAGGGLLARLFGKNAKPVGPKLGFDGKWRNANGSFAKAPPRNFAQRGWDKVRTSRVAQVIDKSPIAKVARAAVNNPVTRVAGRGLGRAAGMGARVLGRLALPVAAGMAIFDGVNGMRNADSIMGRKTNLQEKARVGVAEAVNGALLGLPNYVSEKIFGRSFTSLIVDGVSGIGERLQQKVHDAINNSMTFIGDGIGGVGTALTAGYVAFTKKIARITAVGKVLIDYVSRGDVIGAGAVLGVLAKELSGKLVDTVKAVAAPAIAAVAPAANAAVAGGTTVATAAYDAGTAIGGGVNKLLGSISEKYESGGKGVGTINNGKGDSGGASYGKYQLASKPGTLQKYLKTSGYAAQFAGMAPGSKEFNAKWKELAKSDPKFGESQHEFIKQTHYDPAIKHAAKLGFKVNDRGIQDAVWSASVQHGGVKKILNTAANIPGWANMSAADQIKALYSARATYSKAAMTRQGDGADRIASVQARYTREQKDALALSANSGTATASVSTPKPVATTPKVATTAVAAQEPLVEPIPPPKAAPPVQPKAEATQSNNTSTSSQQQASAARAEGSRTGGLPSVNDVADRPRIDLQAIATTLYNR